MKALLSYFGGKSYLAPRLAFLIIPGYFDLYCEPFCGSAAVFFAAPGRWAKIEVLNDIHHHLINFYRVMQNPAMRQELLDRLELTPHSREGWREARAGLKKDLSPVQAAWCFFVAHQQSFSSNGNSWRIASQTRDHSSEWRNRVENLGIQSMVTRLSQASLECQNFEIILRRFDCPETLFYLDPPYIGAKDQVSMKAAYHGHILTPEQDTALIDFCKSSQAGIILSGYPRDDLPETWQRIEVDVAVHSSTYVRGQARNRATEVIWINPAAQIVRLF